MPDKILKFYRFHKIHTWERELGLLVEPNAAKKIKENNFLLKQEVGTRYPGAQGAPADPGAPGAPGDPPM